MAFNFYFQINDLVEVISASLTPVIAIIAVYISWQQHKINRRNYLGGIYKKIVDTTIMTCVKVINAHEIISERGTELADISFDVNYYLPDEPKVFFNRIFESLFKLINLKKEIDNTARPSKKLDSNKTEYANTLKEIEELFKYFKISMREEINNLRKRTKN